MEGKHDPFERVTAKASMEGELVVDEKKKRAKAIKAGEEGSRTRVDCGLNNLSRHGGEG